MAAPTTNFRSIPNTTATTAVDTAAERLALATGSTVSTGTGNEIDFGTVDISGGAADSNVVHMRWQVTVNGGNTAVDTFKLWIPAASIGFDQAGSVIKVQPVSGADKAVPSLTENYVASTDTAGTEAKAAYTWATMAESEPGATNIYQTDETASIDITTIGTTDDTIMWAMYAAIAASETTGTYKGTDAGNELQFSFKYSYS